MIRKFRIPLTVLQCLVLVLALFVPARPAYAATDILPDLQIDKVRNIKIVMENGRRMLRFTTIIVNTGDGPFEVFGQRPDRNAGQMSTSQRIFDSAGGHRDIDTAAVMVYDVGDGHNHWHLKDLEDYELIRLDNGSKVGVGNKVGYCFFDNVRFRLSLPGAPDDPVYTGCGNRRSLTVNTGLSIGWGDKYAAGITGQSIDITGLSAGRYRLQITSDGKRFFRESNESNNVNWVDLQIQGNNSTSFNIVGRGPNP